MENFKTGEKTTNWKTHYVKYEGMQFLLRKRENAMQKEFIWNTHKIQIKQLNMSLRKKRKKKKRKITFVESPKNSWTFQEYHEVFLVILKMKINRELWAFVIWFGKKEIFLERFIFFFLEYRDRQVEKRDHSHILYLNKKKLWREMEGKLSNNFLPLSHVEELSCDINLNYIISHII